MKSLIAAITSRIPVPDCCPHVDLDDPDTAYLPADARHNDYRGSTR